MRLSESVMLHYMSNENAKSEKVTNNGGDLENTVA